MSALALSLTACLADPQQTESADLLDRMGAVRTQLAHNPPAAEACTEVGDIENRLYGEPGLVEIEPAWSQLANAADALQAVCGQADLLSQPSSGTAELQSARARWQQGLQREIGVSCDHLRAAASALGRPAPC